MPRQPVACGENQAPLLRQRNARASAAKVGAGATAHFDKDRRLSFAADEVDFAALDTKIARHHAESMGEQMLRSGFLAGVADLFGGVGDNASHEGDILHRSDPHRQPR